MIHIGQRLKEIRLQKGLSLEDVAQATKIRSSFLSAIEKGEYHKLPSSSYAQGFVQNYATYLGLPKRETLALFRREFDEKNMIKVLPDNFVQDEKLKGRSIKIHQAVILVGIALILLGSFLFYQYRAAFFAPPLTVSEPTEDISTTTDITVIGTTDPNVTLTINNLPVAVEENGEFTKRITVFPGKSIVTIKAVNNFGKENVIEKTITVKATP